jgi:hypothetical protein
MDAPVITSVLIWQGQVTATWSDGRKALLFEYDPSQIQITAEELIGKTSDQAHRIFAGKAIEYLHDRT